ncbi:uncharacterized protein N7483_003350 [Penicillium malachiteum]|uniref:uncharacterized protein n=1 Tax=Penicillium malachiteum TaxID=1324776 RepID=UPI0025480278|nr:uncharacterized protein N7483_003350 [Penicillium malachiteum]KAJ5728842.1 hypothetical protein N7483_003350 [Penicillium malachiteum]
MGYDTVIRYRSRRTKYLYKTPAGILQLDISPSRPDTSSSSSWQLFTDKKSPKKDIPLFNGFINIALHPLLNSQSEKDGWLSKSIHKAGFLKKSWAIVYVYLPHLYSACSVVTRKVPLARRDDYSHKDGAATPVGETIDLAAAARRDLQIFESVITLLQNHFHFCKSIHLVVKTDINDPTMEMAAWLTRYDDTSVLKFLEENLLPRTDELYHAISQRHQLLFNAEKSLNGLFFLPSMRGFTPFQEQAKLRGDFIREGDWDCNRDAEVAVWRQMDGQAVNTTDTKYEGTKGYWVMTEVFDMFQWDGMKFV